MLLAHSSSRWASWIARIAILFVLIVLLIVDHFSIRFMLFEGMVAPFIFIVAIVMFAFFLCMLLSLLHVEPGGAVFGFCPTILWWGSGGVVGAGFCLPVRAGLGMWAGIGMGGTGQLCRFYLCTFLVGRQAIYNLGIVLTWRYS